MECPHGSYSEAKSRLHWFLNIWKMPPQRTDNERRIRVHLMKKRAHVHAPACNVHVVPINVLKIFSYPKFSCLIFFYSKNWGTYLHKTAYARAHVHVGHVANCQPHRGDTHGWHKKIESIQLTEAIVIPLWSCSWGRGHACTQASIRSN